MMLAEASAEGWWSGVLLVLILFGSLLFAAAIGALYWASRTGQFRNFEKGATTIFDEEEPEGEQIDFFPGDGEEEKAPTTANDSKDKSE